MYLSFENSKNSLSSDGQQLHQYNQDKTINSRLKSLNIKLNTTYDVGNRCPGLGQFPTSYVVFSFMFSDFKRELIVLSWLYWCNCWPSLLKLSFHSNKHNFHFLLLIIIIIAKFSVCLIKSIPKGRMRQWYIDSYIFIFLCVSSVWSLIFSNYSHYMCILLLTHPSFWDWLY
jgi:hypothetical protein